MSVKDFSKLVMMFFFVVSILCAAAATSAVMFTWNCINALWFARIMLLDVYTDRYFKELEFASRRLVLDGKDPKPLFDEVEFTPKEFFLRLLNLKAWTYKSMYPSPLNHLNQ